MISLIGLSRMEFVKRSAFEMLLGFLSHTDDKLRTEASKTLMYLV